MDALGMGSQLPRAVGITAVVALGFAGFLAMQPEAGAWSGLTLGDCTEYCEGSHRCGSLDSRPVVQQPLNAWSNLAYVFVGALALARPFTLGAGLFAASTLLLGAGSFLFHASITREMQWLDMVGTYCALVALLACGVHRVWRTAWSLLLPASLGLDLLIARYKWHLEATVAIPILLVAIAVPTTRAVRTGSGRATVALVPLALFLVAFGVRELDVRHIGCDPASVLYQGHTLWHLLTAASLGASYRFFERSSTTR
jgi:hypothetical protein